MGDPPLDVDQEALESFCEENGIRRLAWFGSVLREEFGPTSDVDVLVEFEDDAVVGLITMARLEDELSKIVGRDVDLRTPADLSPDFRDEVLESSVDQYARA